jgi:hypothetical protein
MKNGRQIQQRGMLQHILLMSILQFYNIRGKKYGPALFAEHNQRFG